MENADAAASQIGVVIPPPRFEIDEAELKTESEGHRLQASLQVGRFPQFRQATSVGTKASPNGIFQVRTKRKPPVVTFVCFKNSEPSDVLSACGGLEAKSAQADSIRTQPSKPGC